MPMSLSYINGLSCFPQLLKLNRLLHPLAGLAGGLKNRQDEVDQYFHKSLNNPSECFLLITDTQQRLFISLPVCTGKTINANGLFSLDWLEIYSLFWLQELRQNVFSPLYKISTIVVGDL